MIESIILFKVLIPSVVAFILGIALTPMMSDLFYKYKLWKRSPRIDKTNTNTKGEGMGEDFEKIYNPDEVKTPRVGGIIVWFSVVMTILVSIIVSAILNDYGYQSFEFITREQTLIPFISLIAGALLGLVDDFLQIFGSQRNLAIGIPRRLRILFVLFLGAIEGMWFYFRLGYTGIDIPFIEGGELFLGMGFILFFIFVVIALFSSSVIDGIDGLAPGVLTTIFASYGFIGIIQGQYDIAAFSFVIMGALLAFLWFNVPPARFYLGETGIIGLTLSLAVIIFLTHTVFEFIIIGLPLVLTSASSLIQIISRRYFHTKVFLVAPLHHHFEALGWSRAKITMRYWIFSVMCAASGIIVVMVV